MTKTLGDKPLLKWNSFGYTKILMHLSVEIILSSESTFFVLFGDK
jgi:hypothetical protein